MEKVEIIERWYCNRVERYVRRSDGSLMPLEVLQYLERPFVEVDFQEPPASTERRLGSTVGSALALRRG